MGIVGELTVVDEQHDGHGGELLGAGGEAEVCNGVDFCVRAQIAHAVAAFEDGTTVLADEDGKTRRVGLSGAGEDGVDLILARLTLRRRGGWFGGPWENHKTESHESDLKKTIHVCSTVQRAPAD